MSTFPDWPSVYSRHDGLLPLAEDPEFVGEGRSTIRRLFLDMSDVAAAVALRANPHSALEIHADVVRVLGPCTLQVCALKIHARRLEARAGAHLGVDNRIAQAGMIVGVSTRGIFEIDAGEVATEKEATGIPIDAFGLHASLSAGTFAAISADYHIPARDPDAPARITIDSRPNVSAGDAWAHSMFLMEAQRLAACEASRQSGSLSLDLAIKMARWVNRCSAQRGGNPRVFAESAALIDRLTGPSRHLDFVPYLNRENYLELAQKTLGALQDVESKYGSFFDRSADGTARAELGEQMLAHYQAAGAYSDKLRRQAEANLERAANASAECARKLEEQQEIVARAAIVFDEGVGIKTKQATEQAVMAGIGCAVALGAAVAMACAGSPAGIGPLTQAATQARDLAAEIERLRQTMSKIARIIEALKKISEAATLLAEIATRIKYFKDAFDQVTQLQGVLDELAGAAAEPMSVRDWEIFELDMAALFAGPIEWGVEGARDYLKQLNILAIRGKESCDAGLHHSVCVQAHERLLWETQRDRADIEQTKAYLARLANNNQINFVTSLFFQRLRDDLRGRLVLAIQNMNAAYRYFALQSSSTTASLTADARLLNTLLAQANEEVVEAMDHFNPRPSSMNLAYTIDAREALSKLRTGGALSFHIPMSEENFPGFFRVRINKLRVWLIGAKHAPKTPIYVAVATSGQYQDRFRGREFDFASLPIHLNFVYEYTEAGPDMDPKGATVTIRGDTEDVLESYFEPTPFTTWSISVAKKYNKGLDLSNLTGIQLDFIGTWVGDPDARGERFTAIAGAAPAAGAPALPAATPLIKRMTIL
jgi:tetratricopeptide (TPR) repeat protein